RASDGEGSRSARSSTAHSRQQAQTGDVLPGVAGEVDRLAEIAQRDVLRVSDDEIERGGAADRLFGSRSNQSCDDHLPVAIAYFGPRRTAIREHDRRGPFGSRS